MAEDTKPDYDTIATFASTNGKAINYLFIQVLMQCAELDLITKKIFTIDGCRLPSTTSKEWSQKKSKTNEFTFANSLLKINSQR